MERDDSRFSQRNNIYFSLFRGEREAEGKGPGGIWGRGVSQPSRTRSPRPRSQTDRGDRHLREPREDQRRREREVHLHEQEGKTHRESESWTPPAIPQIPLEISLGAARAGLSVLGHFRRLWGALLGYFCSVLSVLEAPRGGSRELLLVYKGLNP